MSFKDYLFLPVFFLFLWGISYTIVFVSIKSYLTIDPLCVSSCSFRRLSTHQTGCLFSQAIRLLPPTPMLTGVAYDDFEVAVDGRRGEKKNPGEIQGNNP